MQKLETNDNMKGFLEFEKGVYFWALKGTDMDKIVAKDQFEY